MDIEYIKRFVVVAESLNFSKAAETLFISQPTLSHSIACLEKKLGAKLLLRDTKSAELTRAGKVFLPTAIEIIRLYQKGINDVSQELHLDNDVLKIGYIGPATDNTLSDWIRKFRELYPGIKVHIIRYSSLDIEAAFRNREIHLGVLYKMNADHISGLKYTEVGRERFKVLLNTEHPLASQETVDLTQLKDEPFLICDRSCSPGYYDRVMSICAKRGLKPEISQRVALVGDIYSLVGAGLGYAIMSYSPKRVYKGCGIKFVEIDEGEDLTNSLVMAWMDKLSEAAYRFRGIARNNS